MTRTISIITATVGAALLFALPAYADNWGAEMAQQPSASPELVDLLASVGGGLTATQRMLDARERGLGIVDTPQVNPLDARERGFGIVDTPQVVQPAAAIAVRDYRTPFVDDRFNIDPTAGQPTTAAVSSGREIELPQVGIGLGLGLVLALGLFVAMRHTRNRPLAH